MLHVRRRKPTGEVPASRPQHRGTGSRRAEQYTNARSSCREYRKSYSNLLIRRDLQDFVAPGQRAAELVGMMPSILAGTPDVSIEKPTFDHAAGVSSSLAFPRPGTDCQPTRCPVGC